jgi:hypothetical protein
MLLLLRLVALQQRCKVAEQQQAACGFSHATPEFAESRVQLLRHASLRLFYGNNVDTVAGEASFEAASLQ